MSTLKLLNGGFIAELVKGKNGKDEWQYTPTYKPIQKKVDKGSPKEKPQFAFIEKAEGETVKRYNKVLKSTVLDIVKYLKTV